MATASPFPSPLLPRRQRPAPHLLLLPWRWEGRTSLSGSCGRHGNTLLSVAMAAAPWHHPTLPRCYGNSPAPQRFAPLLRQPHPSLSVVRKGPRGRAPRVDKGVKGLGGHRGPEKRPREWGWVWTPGTRGGERAGCGDPGHGRGHRGTERAGARSAAPGTRSSGPAPSSPRAAPAPARPRPARPSRPGHGGGRRVVLRPGPAAAAAARGDPGSHRHREIGAGAAARAAPRRGDRQRRLHAGTAGAGTGEAAAGPGPGRSRARSSGGAWAWAGGIGWRLGFYRGRPGLSGRALSCTGGGLACTGAAWAAPRKGRAGPGGVRGSGPVPSGSPVPQCLQGRARGLYPAC